MYATGYACEVSSLSNVLQMYREATSFMESTSSGYTIYGPSKSECKCTPYIVVFKVMLVLIHICAHSSHSWRDKWSNTEGRCFTLCWSFLISIKHVMMLQRFSHGSLFCPAPFPKARSVHPYGPFQSQERRDVQRTSPSELFHSWGRIRELQCSKISW